ncbi:hypothetical protein AXF42_Ash003134 [Apostasia shenzhenica]|uniref:Uncharacterized protein n=1 Tax=Apostasia shenzhenica TaxID=1088818 RepID=A0A2I0BFA4_9ASPA|nr:hypothetical protein AXF42_Ash003134 [Apostasia shenzhenica]
MRSFLSSLAVPPPKTTRQRIGSYQKEIHDARRVAMAQPGHSYDQAKPQNLMKTQNAYRGIT